MPSKSLNTGIYLATLAIKAVGLTNKLVSTSTLTSYIFRSPPKCFLMYSE